MSDEKWLPVVGYEGLYEVSDHGRVWSIRRQQFLKPQFHPKNGKLTVTLPGNPRQHKYIHHLVLEAFVGPCPAGKEACHFNDVGTDNKLTNLRWDTRSANKIDSVRNGSHNKARVTECPSGHEYTRENTVFVRKASGGTERRCLICRREHTRLSMRKVRAARKAAA
jgi:hypothetical protein